MGKRITLFMMIVMIIVSFSSCGQSEEDDGDFDVYFFRKVAREVRDDGWVFTFVYEDSKDPTEDDSDIIKYRFIGINIRYRYDENYVQTIVREPEVPGKGATYTQIIYPSVLIMGYGSEAQDRDMNLINKTILDSTRSVEELLALNPDEYEFEVVDKEMFFRLMREALTGEPQKEGTDLSYWNKPEYAILSEPAYLDGYKFQIAFLNETGCVDELYIDVLYQTGDKYTDYVQLSDLVENHTATDEQIEAFARIQAIVNDIKANDNFIVNAAEYKKQKIGGLKFSRLYTFLENIHLNKFELYEEEVHSEIIEGIVQS